MKTFENTYQIELKSLEDFEQKTLTYFEPYNFITEKKEKNKISLSKKSSVWDGWKMNPFNWESIINIKIKNNSAKLSYKVEGVYLSTAIFSGFYNSFIANYMHYINSGKSVENENAVLIKKAKKQSIIYNIILLILVIVGIIAGNYLATIVKNNLIKFFVIVLFVWGGEQLLTTIVLKKQKKL